MASVAASVARLTQPRSQTGRGRPRRPLSADERGERTIRHHGHEDAIRIGPAPAIHGEAVIVPNGFELRRVVVDRLAIVVPTNAFELDPDALVRKRKPRR